MVKNVLIVADLGAGSNVVRNLLSLGEYAWPLQIEKFPTLLNQYRSDLKLQHWLIQEYVLRYWQKFFGIDLSDNLDYKQYCRTIIDHELPIIFINHSAFYQIEEFNKFLKNLEVLFVAPVTKFGLEWQIRAYCEKKTVKLLHDFSFATDKDQLVQNYKNQYGEESYYEMNIMNMKEIINQRQQEFQNLLPPENFLSTESLLFDSDQSIVDFLNARFQQDLPVDQIGKLLSSWRGLHWPIQQTANWKYHHLFS